MGQRFQTAFILPKIYMNDKNPNNKNKRVLVFHNQWLYGKTAIDLNLRLLERIKKGIILKNRLIGEAMTTQHFINHYLENFIKEALDFVSLEAIHDKRQFSLSSEFNFKDFKDLGLNLSREDNNNGYFIIEITDSLKLRYSFISGLEDEDNHNIKTPLEYLKLFYTDKEIFPNSEDGDNLKEIFEGYKNFEEINKPKLNSTIKALNENIPEWFKQQKEDLKNE